MDKPEIYVTFVLLNLLNTIFKLKEKRPTCMRPWDHLQNTAYSLET